jgi:hypothetical protein
MKTGLVLLALGGAAAAAAAATASPAPGCERAVYLTFDTGHMGVAPLVADVLQRHQVKVTFFLANERTRNGGASLDDEWAPWWKARAAEGHAFGSHTWDHDVWRADVDAAKGSGGDAAAAAGGAAGSLRVRPTMGAQAGRERTLTPPGAPPAGHDRPAHGGHLPRPGGQDLAGAAEGGGRVRLHARGLDAGRLSGR